MKILIISYFYPPANSIAALRPLSWANEFSKNHEVKVVTRAWSGNENSWLEFMDSSTAKAQEIVQKNNLAVHYLPYTKTFIQKSTFSFLKVLIQKIKGNIDFEVDTLQFFEPSAKIIHEWKPDFLIVSVPPQNIAKLAFQLHQRTNIPYAVDIRDFQNEIILKKNDSATFKEKLFFKFNTYHTLNNCKKASFMSVINKPFASFFKEKINAKCIEVLNGYEQGIFKNFKPAGEVKNEKFTISIIGTLYPIQDISFMIDMFNLFLNNKDSKKIQIKFIGIDAINEVGTIIKKSIPEEFLLITPKIPRTEALSVMENSDILYYIGWKGYTGVYSGKIFEYLGAQRNILIAPSDKDVIEELLTKTKAGEVANTILEGCQYLEKQYKFWLENGYLKYNGINTEIEFYSRENQATLLLDTIENDLNKY